MLSYAAEKRLDSIRKIENFPVRLEALISDLDDAQLNTQFLFGEWSVAQTIHCLTDLQMNSFICCKLLHTKANPSLISLDQSLWAITGDVHARPIDDSLMILRGLHARWAAFFKDLNESEWARTGIHPHDGVVTLDSLLVTFCGHCDAHIAKIEWILSGQASYHESHYIP